MGNVVGMCTYKRQDFNGLGFVIAMSRMEDKAHELLDERHMMVEEDGIGVGFSFDVDVDVGIGVSDGD